MRSSEPSRLDRLSRGNQRDAALNEAFVVLSIGASLIATLGLLANSADVVIGAMVVAPWIKPLRAGAFAVLLGDVPLLIRALRTLLLGVGTTLVLAALLGTVAGLPQFGREVMARTSPNLLNLGIALVAGALATGAGLLFATNLLGVLTGGVVLMAWKDPLLRQQLRRSHLSVANFALTGLLLIPLGTSFLGLLRNARRESTRETVQLTIETFLKRQTVTFGEGKEVELEKLEIDWDPNPPVIRALVRVTDPTLPTFKQVSAVQDEINRRQIYRFQLVVQRTAVDVVGPEEAPNPSTVAEDSVLQSIPPTFPPLLSPPPLPAAPPEQQQDN